jgi:hypothetical protein
MPPAKKQCKIHLKSRSANKVHKNKQPVKHAVLGQSSLVHQLEKAKADLEAMRLKYKSLLDSSSDAQKTSSDGVEVCLIPKPPGEVGRSGENPKKRGYHLQMAMGLKKKKGLYNKIRVSP